MKPKEEPQPPISHIDVYDEPFFLNSMKKFVPFVRRCREEAYTGNWERHSKLLYKPFNSIYITFQKRLLYRPGMALRSRARLLQTTVCEEVKQQSCDTMSWMCLGTAMTVVRVLVGFKLCQLWQGSMKMYLVLSLIRPNVTINLAFKGSGLFMLVGSSSKADRWLVERENNGRESLVK